MVRFRFLCWIQWDLLGLPRGWRCLLGAFLRLAATRVLLILGLEGEGLDLCFLGLSFARLDLECLDFAFAFALLFFGLGGERSDLVVGT